MAVLSGFIFWGLVFGQGAQAEPQNLLAGKQPVVSDGVKNPGRLTDGLYCNEGDEWLTDLTARFSSPRSYLEYNLGDETPIRCAIVQADNNDVYFLSGSADGVHWQPLWRVGAEGSPGMRVRTQKLDAKARYLRLSATGGDALYSVSEIAIYSQCPQIWPPDLVRTQGVPVSDTLNTKLVIFGIIASLFLLFHRRRAHQAQYVMLLPVLGAGWMLAMDFANLYPFFEQEPQLRALIAFLTILLLAKEAFFKKEWAPHRLVVMGSLAVFAVTAFGTYYHFGMPQFFDQAKGRRTLVHTWDMRHYFPVAKYFRELRFDGLYVASLAAYIDNNPGFTSDQMARVHFRDLRDAEMRSGTELASEVESVRKRFTPERWEEFKRDMKYFTETMGDQDYLGSMQDHGGNATPVWILPAYFIFKNAPANEWTLSLAGLIDPVMVLILFGFLVRAFGWRNMLYIAILWGASDFYNFGSNLMGSTLRQDWLVALGLGACAIKLRWPFLGGVLIAYGGLIRAFPAMASFFLAVPVVWFAVDHWRAHRRMPSLADFKAAQRPALRAMAGVIVCVVSFLLVTSALFGARDSWGKWYQKIEIHATGPSTNNVGLRNVMAFDPKFSAQGLTQRHHPEVWKEWERTQRSTFDSRRWLHYSVLLIATALALIACRGRSLEQVAMIGLVTIPFFFYPSNYYCHYVFLIPLAVAVQGRGSERDRPFAVVYIVLALMAIGQFFSLSEGWTDLRYTYQSILLLVGSLWILIELAVDSLRSFPLWRGGTTEGGAGGDDEVEDDDAAENFPSPETPVKRLGSAPS
jgi:hypothetical protein